MIPIFSRVTEWILILVGSSLILLSQPIQAAKLADWKAEYNPGAGLSLASPDGDFRFRQLGYLQVRGDLRHPDFQRPSQGEFSIRRARLDWIIDIEEKYQLFLETDGADFNGPNQSDFDLVVARISGPSFGGGRWYAGKFITPFSTENNRSSRSLDMIERYTALNSLFLLPALDVQFGGMLEQPLSDDWTVYAGLFNGNGRAADNLSDDNDQKEFQLKLRQDVTDSFRWSLSYDRSDEARSEQQPQRVRAVHRPHSGVHHRPHRAVEGPTLSVRLPGERAAAEQYGPDERARDEIRTASVHTIAPVRSLSPFIRGRSVGSGEAVVVRRLVSRR